jgi:hypothetical protein
MTLKRRLSTPLAIATLVACIAAPEARAGTYEVFSCWAGSDSFRNPAANGSAWAKFQNGDRYYAFDQCGASDNGFGVIAVSGYEAPPGGYGEISFSAPQGTAIEHVRLWRMGWSYGSGSGGASQRNYLYTLADGSVTGRGDVFDGSADVPHGAAGSTDVSNRGLIAANALDFDVAANTPSTVAYRVGCRFSPGCPTGDANGNFAAGVKVYGTVVTLRDPSDPDLSVAGSGLLGGGTHAGTELVRVTAARDNTGIKRLAVFADDGTTPIGVVDYERNPDKCAWWRSVPCTNASDVDIPVDTRRVADGRHRFVVRAYDAAENVRSHISEQVTVRNNPDVAKADSGKPAAPAAPAAAASVPAPFTVRGAPNGIGATDRAVLSVWFAPSRRTSLMTAFSRPAELDGRLVDEDRRPIIGAELEVASRSSAGGPDQVLGVAHTTAEGRFRFTIPARGPSRELVVTYRAHVGDAAPVAARSVALKVVAGVSLRVGPHRVRNGRAVTFRGALLGGPVPASGKLVDMQVHVGGRWQTFATTRARGQAAAFRYRYRFTRTTSRMVYRFRALVRADGAYPYATGASGMVRVRVN